MEHLILMQVKGWYSLGGLLYNRKSNNLLGRRLKMNAEREIDGKKPTNPNKQKTVRVLIRHEIRTTKLIKDVKVIDCL